MTVSELQDKFYDKLGFRRLEIYNNKMEDGRINVFITYCAMKVRLSARALAWANRELKNKVNELENLIYDLRKEVSRLGRRVEALSKEKKQ